MFGATVTGRRPGIDADGQDRERVRGVAVFLWLLPSLEVIWLLSWLYRSALGGSGGWVSLSSRPSRLLLDYTKESRMLKKTFTRGVGPKWEQTHLSQRL